MKKILFAMTAIGALAVAAPAAAQYGSQTYANAGVNAGFDSRIAQLEARFQAGIQQGLIDRREAYSLRQQLRDLRRLESRYSYNGLSMQERADLQQRLRFVRQNLRLADGGGNGRYSAYDNDPYYGQSGNYGQNGTYYGQGGPYQVPDNYACQSRGGIGGILDNVLGGGCLRVGQRVSGNLSAVPYEYRSQYRDGGGVYYRSDGRAIYEIDARTNTVIGVYGMAR